MARMGNHCVVCRGRADFSIHLEVWLRHVEVNDHQHAPATTIW